MFYVVPQNTTNNNNNKGNFWHICETQNKNRHVKFILIEFNAE